MCTTVSTIVEDNIFKKVSFQCVKGALQYFKEYKQSIIDSKYILLYNTPEIFTWVEDCDKMFQYTVKIENIIGE